MSAAGKGLRAAADLVMLNARYVGESGTRTRMREALKRDEMTSAQRRIHAREIARMNPAAAPYAGLTATSVTLAGIRPGVAAAPHLNLLIGELRQSQLFAGIHTALGAARSMAASLQLPLRVVMLDFTSPGNGESTVRRLLSRELGMESVDVVRREQISEASFSGGDVWLATHSKTAHAAQVACIAGLIDPARVAYLIQDYEPSFSPGSTESIVAAETYRAGFLPIVNSTPLWKFLTEVEHLSIPRELVFAPALDEARLRRAAEARRGDSPVSVLFYARPSKPRNLFALGISALRATAASAPFDAKSIRFVSAGEEHAKVELAPDVELVGLGRLGWDAYFDQLAHTSVVLALQASPHPSHPPFDAAISGALAVTNELAGTRSGLHPRIRAVEPDTEHLAQGIVDAIGEATSTRDRGYLPLEPGLLGNPIEDVVAAAVSHLAIN